MSQCPLCGQKGMSDGRCQVCGYASEATLHGDVRDERRSDPLKQTATTQTELQKRYKLIEANLSSIDMAAVPPDEASATLSAAVQQLSIPAHVPFDKVIRLTDIEVRLVHLIARKLEEADGQTGGATLDSESYIRLANAIYAAGESDAAISLVDKAILREPRSLEGHYARARIQFSEKRYGMALRSVSKAVQMAPGDRDLLAFKALLEQMASTE